MKLKEIYNLAIAMGVDSDFRGKEEIEKLLRRLKEKYGKMEDWQKEDFDIERLINPFSDTRILYGDSEKVIKKILVGIDIDGEELLLAKDLGDIDLVLSHHPRGKALAGLDDVMQLQIDVLAQYGVPVNIAEKLMKKRMEEVARGIAPANHNRPVDMAKILDIPFLCVHTPSDNLAARFLEKKITQANPHMLEDIMRFLREIPEYREATKIGAGPKIFVGSEENRVGKIAFTEITGGTEGAAEMYEKLAQAGVGTIIGMHVSEKHREEAEKAHINVVIAGHMSSDSIGLNLFLDELEKKGIKIVPCGGLIRVKRI